MNREPVIELRVNGWKWLSLREKRRAAKWLKECIDNLVEIGESVSDEFTGTYP